MSDTEKKVKKEKKEKKVKKEKEEESGADETKKIPEKVKKEKRAEREEEAQEAPTKKSKKSKKHHEEEVVEEAAKEEEEPVNKVKFKKESGPQETGIGSGSVKDLWKNGEAAWRENSLDAEYLQNNPDGITRLFCGNLKLDITEEQLREHLPNITYIRWQKDKTTKEFYGSTFLEMRDAKAAALAVSKDRTKFMGRPLKIYYCPPRPGDVWPPSDYGSGGLNSTKGNVTGGRDRFNKPKTPKPPGGRKLYMGNLSFDIDDETITGFFKECGEMRGLRWLVNADTGAFRGGGFVEFETSEAADKALLLDGQELLGRAIRLDWTL